MTTKIKSVFLFPTLIALIIITFASNLIINNYFINTIDNKFLDFHFNRRGEIFSDKDNRVIVVGISNETLRELPHPYHQWPLSRDLFAKAIKNLNEAGVKAIGIDLLFSEPDRYDRKNDSLLLKEINRYNNVILAAKLDVLDKKFVTFNKESNNYSNYYYYSNDDQIGLVNVIPDFDGVIRRYYPKYYDLNKQKYLPTFSFSVFDKYIKKTLDAKNDSTIKFTNCYSNQPIIINYFGSYNTFPIIELIDILDDKDFKTISEIETETDINTWDDQLTGLKYTDLFEDKIILIGSVEPEDKDIYPVSISSDRKMEYGNLMFGVEIHANVVQMLIKGNWISEVSDWLIVLLIFLTAYFSAFLFDIQKKIKYKSLFLSETINLILVITFLFLVYEFSFFLFKSNYLLSITSISLTIVTVYIGNLVVHYLSERKQKLMIKNMFSHYVSSKIVEDLIENPEKLKLGGERKVLTILFSDITNFTTLSESTEPEILVDFMNDYFDSMTEIIFKYNGTLDKFEGDAIMAFWNAPLADSDHTAKAISAALEIRAETYRISERWKEKLRFDIKTRIGINTGEVIVGNMGSHKKFDYTVMGDNVNISARLEAINKFYNTNIIVSEQTIKTNRDIFIVRELDTLLVKGKSKPIKIYEVIDHSNQNLLFDYNKFIDDFETGIKFYKQREFLKAKEKFENALKINNQDIPSLIYIQRCDEFIQNPPDENWQGISEVHIK